MFKKSVLLDLKLKLFICHNLEFFSVLKSFINNQNRIFNILYF